MVLSAAYNVGNASACVRQHESYVHEHTFTVKSFDGHDAQGCRYEYV